MTIQNPAPRQMNYQNQRSAFASSEVINNFEKIDRHASNPRPNPLKIDPGSWSTLISRTQDAKEHVSARGQVHLAT